MSGEILRALPYHSWAFDYRLEIKRVDKLVRKLPEDDKAYLGKIFDLLESRYQRSPGYYKEVFSNSYPEFPIEKLEYYFRCSTSGALWIHAFMLFENELAFMEEESVQPQ